MDVNDGQVGAAEWLMGGQHDLASKVSWYHNLFGGASFEIYRLYCDDP